MSVFIRIEGFDPEDLADADAHDLADRVFNGLINDYPDLFEDLTGVIPVLDEDEHDRLVTVSNIERPTDRDEAIADRQAPLSDGGTRTATDEAWEPWCDWCQRVFGADGPDWTVETDVVTGWFCSEDCADSWDDDDDYMPERVGEPEIATDGGPDLATYEFGVQDDGSSIVYGPWDEDADEWMLGVSTEDGERVRLLLGEAAMYELWTETHNTPWPREAEPRGTLQREIVEKVNGMDEDQLREVLATVDEVGGAER